MEYLLLMVLGFIVGLACIALGLWGLLIGRTLSAYHFNKGTIARESRARFYGIVWLVLGAVLLLLVIVRTHQAAQAGLSFTAEIPAALP